MQSGNEYSVDEEHATSSHEALGPYRHLALRVLALAFLDVVNSGGSGADRDSARAFLAGSGMLVHWCRVADLEPGCIVRLAKKLGGASASAPRVTRVHCDRAQARSVRETR